MKQSIVSAVSLLLLSSLVAAQAVAQDQTDAPKTEPGTVDAKAAPRPPAPPAPPPPLTPPAVSARPDSSNIPICLAFKPSI